MFLEFYMLIYLFVELLSIAVPATGYLDKLPVVLMGK